MDRRSFLSFFGCGVAASAFPIQAFGKTPDNNKLIVILLRGALDGLAAFPSFGDPYLERVRGDLVDENDFKKLGNGFFGIHNSLSEVHNLFNSNDLLLFHAISMPEVTRSHFVDQDMLEFANSKSETGWLGRAMNHNNSSAIGVGSQLPKILWGNSKSSSWQPKKKEGATDEFYETAFLLSEADYEIHEAISSAYDIKNISEGASENPNDNVRNNSAATTAKGVANLLMHSQGNMTIEASPDIGVISLGGWDTHNRQIARSRNSLKALDDTIKTLRREFAPIWDKTTILVTTEFGRTVESNGAGGTDHGYGSVCLLAGGNITGGLVYTDWNGLNNLNEDRDLRSTLDLQDVFSSVAHSVLNVPKSKLGEVFPMKSNPVTYNIFK